MKHPRRSLGELCTIAAPLVDPTEDQHGNLPHVGAANIESGTGRLLNLKTAKEDGQISPKFLFTAEDVLFCKIRPYLRKVATPDFTGLCSADIYPLRPHQGVLDRRFLAALLLSDDAASHFEQGAARSGIPKVNREHLFRWKMSLPTPDEQRRIVARLDALMARVAEVEGLSREVQEDISRVEEAGVEEVLAWARREGPQVRLGDVVHRVQYGSSAKASAVGSTIVLRMGNLRSGRVDLSDLKYLDPSPVDTKKYALVSGDVLVNRTNSLELVGKAACVQEVSRPMIFASYLMRVAVDREAADPGFVADSINSRQGREYITTRARRAIGMVNINARELAAMPLVLPPLARQRECTARIERIRLAMDRYRAERGGPEGDLRSAILRRAFAGAL